MEPEENVPFEPCAVPDCGVKVPEKEPILDFAAFIEQENILISLHEQEIREIASSEASTSSSVTLKPSNYQRKGKPTHGPVTTAGYNALRSDFETEYDNQAELLLGTREDPMETATFLDKGDQQLCDSFQYAIISMYQRRLLERERRKNLIRDHALIDSKKTYTLQQRLELPFGNSSKNLLILMKFIRFFTGPEFDYLVESLMHQTSLRRKVNNYLNYRSQGIRFKSGVKIFENLNKKHLKNFNEASFRSIALSQEIVGGVRSGRKPSAPLVLHNLPGYNLLDEDEKQLCSTVRIVPETYHNFKRLLVTECHRHDGLKLATARQVIKIDVNKTRKMFDLLRQKKLIWLPKSSRNSDR